MEDDALVGGCACGRVRYRLTVAPIVVHGCHCRFCQRLGGSAFGVNAMIEADRVALTGAARPEAVPTPSALPAGQKVHRCPTCKVAVWSNHALLGDAFVFVYAGTLDKGELLSPDVHCYTATKHPWLVLPEGVPAFEGNYDEREVWSAGARARIEAALGGKPGPQASSRRDTLST